MSLCNLAALRSSQPLPRGAGAPGGMQGVAAGATEDISSRKIFIRGLSW